MIRALKRFIQQNRSEFILISLILVISLGLRLYRIDEFMTFLGDEGRDVRIVRDLIVKGDLVFIGPQTSIGNMYLGPLYYYMMAPALFFSGLSPVGPAMMVALLGTLTIWFTWYVARTWFGKVPAIVAASLFAVSPVAIIYSRSSWNPNPMPLFALLCAWGVYQIWTKHAYKWLPVVGISLAFALQMHYLGLMLVPFLGLFWLITFWQIRNSRSERRHYLVQSALAGVLFLLLMSPLLFFDIKHQWMNFNAFKSFFSDRQTTINLNPTRSDRFLPVALTATTDLVLARQPQFAMVTLIAILCLSVVIYFRSTWKTPLKFLYLWLGFALLGLSIYKQHVYIHYLGFIYPAIYLLLAAIIGFLYQQKLVGRLISFLVFVFLLTNSLIFSPVKDSPNRQLSRTVAVVDLILSESKGEPFNFGLIAKQNYDESYRYFLENSPAKLVRGEDRVVDQLFVVCEDGDKCQPLGNPQWQVAVFGIAQISQEWNIDGVKLYQLTHPHAIQ